MSALASSIRPFASQSPANDLAPQRHEIYHLVHKGLRACMGEALTNLGRVDLDTPLSVAGALNATEELLQLCAEHLDHENRFLHTALERAKPGASARCAADHAHHVKAIEGLTARLAAAREAEPPEQERALKVLYRLLALFVAENFQHMEIEESENTALLWAHYSDAELHEIEQAIHAHIKPERMLVWLRWMLPHVTRQQRAAMLKSMQAGMPAAVFTGVLDMVRPHLGPAERLALAEDLA
jgi:hypothetical protein